MSDYIRKEFELGNKIMDLALKQIQKNKWFINSTLKKHAGKKWVIGWLENKILYNMNHGEFTELIDAINELRNHQNLRLIDEREFIILKRSDITEIHQVFYNILTEGSMNVKGSWYYYN